MGETKYYGACDDLANLHAENEHCKNWVPQLDEPLEPEASSLPASPAPHEIGRELSQRWGELPDFTNQRECGLWDACIAMLAEARAGDQGERDYDSYRKTMRAEILEEIRLDPTNTLFGMPLPDVYKLVLEKTTKFASRSQEKMVRTMRGDKKPLDPREESAKEK